MCVIRINVAERCIDTVAVGFAPQDRAICIPIIDIAAALGPPTSRPMPFINSLSGRDTIRQWKEDLD